MKNFSLLVVDFKLSFAMQYQVKYNGMRQENIKIIVGQVLRYQLK